MITERPSTTSELKAILQNEYGVHIHPKRSLAVPALDDQWVVKQFLPQLGYYAVRRIGQLKNFLGMDAMADDFGSNHDERRKWRVELAGRFGMDFYNLYRLNNQFSGNVLSMVRLSALSLRDYASESKNLLLHPKLQEIARQMDVALNGDPAEGGRRKDEVPYYNTLESPVDKLRVIHRLEDLTIEEISLFVR